MRENTGIYPYMSNTTCMNTKLRRAGQNVTRLYNDALAPSGLTTIQYSQLLAVSRLKTPSLSELAEETHLDRSTLGRNVRVLARLGLVQFVPGADGRTRVVTLTDKGQAAIAAAEPCWHAVQDLLADRIGEDQRATLFDLLDELETLAL